MKHHIRTKVKLVSCNRYKLFQRILYKIRMKIEPSSLLWMALFVIFIGVITSSSLMVAEMHFGFGLFWLVVVVVAVYALARERAGPQEIADERYAKGEISRKDYIKLKQNLKKYGETRNA